MANFRKNEDSSDDDFSDNLKLTERLRINRENKLVNFQKKNLKDDQSSSSSSLEMHNEPHKPGTSRVYCPHNKKRQNGDKNAELLANPKRTCLSNRFPRSDNQNKKKSHPAHVQMSTFNQCTPDPSRKHLFADKTYEDHLINLTDGHASAFKPVKQYSKKSIFSNLEDKPRSIEDVNYVTTKIPEYHKPQNSQNEFSKTVNSDRDPSKKFLWRAPQNDIGEHSRPTKNKNVKPVSYTAPAQEFYKDAAPNMPGNVLVHYVDSASDEDSRSMIKSGSLKGGRQSPELSQSHKKVVGRKVKKKVLDSDDDTDDDWLSGNRSRPCLVFSSSDSEVESSSRKGAQKSPASAKNNVNHSIPVGDVAISKKEFQCQMPKEYQEACYSRDNSFASPSAPLVYHSKSPARSYRNRKHSRSNAVPDVSNNFHYNRNPGTAARGRNRVNVGDRYARRSGSPHPRTLPNSLPRMTRPDAPKSSKGRSLTGSHVRRANRNLATTYPDIFDAEDSSEVEFFTANSYSDTETSAESFGGLRISTTVRNPENNGVICEHSINVGSSEDEISVVFSTGPHNRDSRVESQVVRNGESRRGPRNLGRRRPMSPWAEFQEIVREIETLPPSPDPVAQVRQVHEDEVFARMLQAQFDAETDPTYESPLPPVIYPSYSVEGLMNTTDDTDNEFHWDFQPVDLDATLRFRTRSFAMAHHTPTVGSALYNNRRLARNRRRQVNDVHNRLARVIRTGMFGNNFSDLLSSDDSYETFLGIAELNGDVPRGLQRGEINRLPTRKFLTANGEGSVELPHKRAGLNKECQVCLTDYVNGDTLRILPCFHEFHTPCIDPWLKINHTCPVCRVVVDLDG